MSDSAIRDTTRRYDAGQTFNYAQWNADTRITLSNVPWNSDYRDIVKFENQAALDRYIDGQGRSNINIANVNYARPTAPIRLNIPLHEAQEYNYLRAKLPIQPVPGNDKGRAYYYFILDVQHIAPNVTQFVLQLDVWQSFGRDLKFGNSYIERGHIGIAHTKQFDNYGRDYLTIPEGLDVGSEYRHVAKRNIKVFEKATGNVFRDFNILVASTVDLEADPGTVKEPNLVTARGDDIQGMPSGASYYVFRNAIEFREFMAVYSGVPWVTQGIISVTAVPNVYRYGYTLERRSGYKGVTLWKFSGTAGQGQYHSPFVKWRDSDEILGDIPKRYRHLKKFLTYPYLVIEITTWTGSPIVLKPEAWADPDARTHEKVAYTPPNARVVIYPNKYNANPGSTVDQLNNGIHTDFYDDNGDYLDISTQISSFPSFALVNNMALNFMAANAHGLNQSFKSADWSQQRALTGNENAASQATAGMNAANQQNTISRNADALTTIQQNEMNALGMGKAGASGLAGLAGAAATRSPSAAAGAAGGLLGSAYNYVNGVNNNNVNWGIRNNAGNDSNAVSLAQQGFLRDTNKSYADFAAKGDYANEIAGINARVQDAQLTQPSVSGQVGGEAFNIINNTAEFSIRWKMVPPAEQRAIGEYWLRYGYAVRQFGIIPNSLMVMSNFTYWKLKETYLLAARIPESFKQAIRGIFESGVTVWNDPTKIGTIDIADNVPLSNIKIDTYEASTPPTPITPPPATDVISEDKLNIVQVGNDYYAVGKEYVRWLTSDTGIAVPTKFNGFNQLITKEELQQLFLLNGIPLKYMDVNKIREDYPDDIWSKERDNAKAAESYAIVANNNATDIKGLLGDILNALTVKEEA